MVDSLSLALVDCRLIEEHASRYFSTFYIERRFAIQEIEEKIEAMLFSSDFPAPRPWNGPVAWLAFLLSRSPRKFFPVSALLFSLL